MIRVGHASTPENRHPCTASAIRGAALVEYVLIAKLVILSVIGLVWLYGDNIRALFACMDNSLAAIDTEPATKTSPPRIDQVRLRAMNEALVRALSDPKAKRILDSDWPLPDRNHHPLDPTGSANWPGYQQQEVSLAGMDIAIVATGVSLFVAYACAVLKKHLDPPKPVTIDVSKLVELERMETAQHIVLEKKRARIEEQKRKIAELEDEISALAEQMGVELPDSEERSGDEIEAPAESYTTRKEVSVAELGGRAQRALNLLKGSRLTGGLLKEFMARDIPIRMAYRPESTLYAWIGGVDDGSGGTEYHLGINLAGLMDIEDARLAGNIAHEMHHLLKEILDPEGWRDHVLKQYPHLTREQIRVPGPATPRGTIHGEYEAHVFEMQVYEELRQKTGEPQDPYMTDFREAYDRGEDYLKSRIRESNGYRGLPEF